MGFQPLMGKVLEKKSLSWASRGLLIFLSAFLWAPSRDGLQVVYLLAFFLPMLLILPFRKPNFLEYGGWATLIALLYAGFSTFSTFWGEPKDFVFFVLQWCVLASWLCGTCLVFLRFEVDVQKYLDWLIVLGVVIILISILHYYYFVYGVSSIEKRLWGWNVFRNANEIGAMCGIVALIAFITAIQSLSLRRVWLFYAFTLLACLGLIASFSRGALIAFCLMAFIALIIVRPPLKIWLPPMLIAVIAILLLLIKTNLFRGYTDGHGEGLGIRAYIWENVFNRCLDNLALGVGMSKNNTIVVPEIGIFNHAHNAWLDTLYRSGLVGLTLIILHFKVVIEKSSRDPRLLPLCLWLIYGCICNLFDGRVFFGEVGAKWFLYWIPAGLIVATYTGILVRESQTKLDNVLISSKTNKESINDLS